MALLKDGLPIDDSWVLVGDDDGNFRLSKVSHKERLHQLFGSLRMWHGFKGSGCIMLTVHSVTASSFAHPLSGSSMIALSGDSGAGVSPAPAGRSATAAKMERQNADRNRRVFINQRTVPTYRLASNG